MNYYGITDGEKIIEYEEQEEEAKFKPAGHKLKNNYSSNVRQEKAKDWTDKAIKNMGYIEMGREVQFNEGRSNSLVHDYGKAMTISKINEKS